MAPRTPGPRPRRRRPGASTRQTDEHEVGLYRLVEEFTALRHELKLQTKSAARPAGAGRGPLAGAAAGDRAVPLGRAARGAGGLGGGQAPGRGAGRPRRGPRPRPVRDREGPAAARRGAPPASLKPRSRRFSPASRWLGRRLVRATTSGARARRAARAATRGGALRRLARRLRPDPGAAPARHGGRAASSGSTRVGRPVDPERMTVIEVVDDPDRPPARWSRRSAGATPGKAGCSATPRSGRRGRSRDLDHRPTCRAHRDTGRSRFEE